ncbi:efflux RND transporter periplasmic adaptor subunit [Desulfogranum mediterraneum]|uniref:efflux RND transporter periplasmic adaptor subunit n=1 Tax=Desulfogranum mediterraneum TaxID=160661 RepID=UPI000413822F|nr:efflux RND transporter periplasmic adaptor subunit [Desulfogranum mediterraneum]
MNHHLFHSAILSLILCLPAAHSATVEKSIEYEGLIEPSQLVNVGTPVEGIVAQVNVQRSTLVTKGEALVLLESSVETAVVERAQALATVEGEIEVQRERLAFARRMFARVDKLYRSEAISAEKRDEADTEVSLALARLKKAQENRILAKMDLERAQAMLARRTINSPISGIVVERFVAPGEFVDSQPLVRVAQMDPLRVEMILPAELFRRIKPGMQAEVTPESQGEGSYTSTVTIVDRVIDAASGTFGVRLELPNPDYRLPGGLKCSVRFVEDVATTAPGTPEPALNTDTVAIDAQQQALLTTMVQ